MPSRYRLGCCKPRWMPSPSGGGVFHEADCPKLPGAKLTKRELAEATAHPSACDHTGEHGIDRDDYPFDVLEELR